MNQRIRTSLLLTLLLISSLLPFNSLAIDAQVVNKGQASPYEGIVLDKDMSKIIADKVMEGETNKQIITSLEVTRKLSLDSLHLAKADIAKLMDVNVKLKKQCDNNKHMLIITGIGAFVAGALIYREYGR